MSIGTEATITPLSPPITKMKKKPSTKRRGVLKTGLPSHNVANQQKI